MLAIKREKLVTSEKNLVSLVTSVVAMLSSVLLATPTSFMFHIAASLESLFRFNITLTQCSL